MAGKLKFAVESRAFAEALRLEHEALGSLLAVVPETAACSAQILEARKAWDSVEFQKKRVQAAQGVKA